ncbi:MAG: alpha/beta hydrolase [Pirellulaceae bacterium]|nr:alpha/beta hydrolase [Pirellulaceae bacterium]
MFFASGAIDQLFGSVACGAEPTTVRLWEGDAPGALGSEEKDIPTAIVYLPAKASAPTGAIVICPGGGYGHLAIDHEGHQIAAWANEMGLAGIIVSYRHRQRGYGHPAPLLDAQRAIRLTRQNASQWNIDPNRVGVIGFSAGGHLVTTVLTHFDLGDASAKDAIDKQSCRPDFGIVCYAVISLGEIFTHGGSMKNLLGENADPELVKSLSNERQVTAETPPCFVWSTAEDPVVPVENSLRFVSALAKAGVPVELHVFPQGRHGIGLGADIPGASQWPSLCHDWLRRLNIAK